MKTITEYEPMIFTAMFAESERRKSRRIPLMRMSTFVALSLYILLAFRITADTGLAVWDWRFWLIFGPLFVLGERLLRLLQNAI
jgi:hypothetical protein